MKVLSISLICLAAAILGCSKPAANAQSVGGQDEEIPGNKVTETMPETEKLVRNPLTGWAIYGYTDADPNFWKDFDDIASLYTGTQSRISDYATILYLRVGWADLEPTEGEYAWQKNAKLMALLKEAKDRNMKMAFRVVVDSRDKPRDFTPPYVRQAGAQGFTSGSKNVWTPYADDPVFQEKYDKFLKAFAAAFNNPDAVDFIDGYGLGKWGESHSVAYINEANQTAVFNWITGLYLTYFTKVPLAINYHRLIGTSKEWGASDPVSRALLDVAFNKGYMLRHDAFGMTDYYTQYEQNIAAQWFPTRPVICEGGWLHNGDGYLKDPRGYKNWGDVWKGEYDDAVKGRVNVMDLRDTKEVSSWFETSLPLIKKFIATGGYRLYPERVSVPEKVGAGAQVTITHRWQNLGMGVCPTNLPQWNQKYKVAFALLDKNDQTVKKSWVDTGSDLSKWLSGTGTSYRFTPVITGVPAGKYQWAVAIVDITRNNEKGINLSVKATVTPGGWLPLTDVEVK